MDLELFSVFLAAAPPEASETAAEGGNKVTELFKTFKVTWPNFIAQWVSFIIVALLLKKFAFGPVQEILEKRRKRIEEGEAKLQEIEDRLAASERETQAAIDAANEQAKRLVEEAKESAAALGEKKTQEAVTSAQEILRKAEEAAKAEREKMHSELKKEFGRLVSSTTAQVTGKVLNDDDQRRINEEALAKIGN